MTKYELLSTLSEGGATLSTVRDALQDGQVLKKAFGIPDWNGEGDRPEADVLAEKVSGEAHDVVLALIEEYGEDFSVAPYMASCSKALEHAEFDTEMEAKVWVDEMNARFPVRPGDAESEAYYMDWVRFAASVGE